MQSDLQANDLKKIIWKKQKESQVNLQKVKEIKAKIQRGEFDAQNKDNPRFKDCCLNIAKKLIESEEEKYGPIFKKNTRKTAFTFFQKQVMDV